MQIRTTNVVTGNISLDRLTISNVAIVNSIAFGNLSFTPNTLRMGNVVINTTAIYTPQLLVGGILFAGGVFDGIVSYSEYTANGTWYNPLANAAANTTLTGNEQVLVTMWGGGGSGGGETAGGGGGAYTFYKYRLSELQNTVSVIVGTGGTVLNTPGGDSRFGSPSNYTYAYGGGGGNSSDDGGGGAGWMSAGGTGTEVGGDPVPGAQGGLDSLGGGMSIYGGGGGTSYTGGPAVPGGLANGVGGNSVFGGGGGGNIGRGGYSLWGGGGGSANVIGLSVYGGNGGNNTVAATIPGGGGGAGGLEVASIYTAGARGEVRVWVLGRGGTTTGTPTYTLLANTTSLRERSSVLFTVSTTNVANGTTLYYTLNNSSTAVAADFSTAVNGSVVISNNSGTFTLTAASDVDTANEAFQIDVRTSNSVGTIVTSNGSVNILPSAAVEVLATSNSVLSAGTYTFNNITTGTATSDRVLVLVFNTIGNGTTLPTATVTIDGVTANLHTTTGVSASSNNPTAGYTFSGLASLLRTTGTTCNIAIAFSSAPQKLAFSLYSVKNAACTVPRSTSIIFSNTSTVLSNSISVVDPGVIIGGGISQFNPTSRMFSSYSNTTYSGSAVTYQVTPASATNTIATNLREDYDYSYETNTFSFGASAMVFGNWA